jgi:signal transduction histidine kinase/HAMP domain-containing protein
MVIMRVRSSRRPPRSRISHTIILPYLLLALILSLTVTFLGVRLTVGTLQERLSNRLIEAGQATSDGLVLIEARQLTQLRAMVFTQGVDAALQAADADALEALLYPHWVNEDLATLIAFTVEGAPLLSRQRSPEPDAAAVALELPVPQLDTWWLVQQIVAEERDEYGDKFTAFQDGHLFTVAPVRRSGELVGGLMVGIPIDALLAELQGRSNAGVTTFYNSRGTSVATSQVLVEDFGESDIPPDALTQLEAARIGAEPVHIQSVLTINGRGYQFAYSPLKIRRTTDGFFGVGLSRNFIVDAWARGRLLVLLFGTILIMTVISIGLIIARRITLPLHELLHTARAVTRGDLQRRSHVTSRNELGLLSSAFNHMTGRLLHFYQTSRALNTHFEVAAILSETNAAVQPLVPGTMVLALLKDRESWRCYAGDTTSPLLQAWHTRSVDDVPAVMALMELAEQPVALESTHPALGFLDLPADAVAELCCATLITQGRLLGLLLLLHPQPETFTRTQLEPLTIVTSMTAAALYNTQLYLEVQAEGNYRRVILESITDGVVVCDTECRVVLMNPAAEKLFDIYDWAWGRYQFDQLPLTPLSQAGAFLGPTMQMHTRYQVNSSVVRLDRMPLSTRIFSGEVIVLQDITDEVAMDQAKTDLVAVISHELRTPLTTIQGAVEMLLMGVGGALPPEQTELVEMASRQTSAMRLLIEKAILVTKIETGALTFELTTLDLRSMIETVVNSLRSAADTAGVELLTELPADLPPVQADTQLLQVALLQLVDNAIKYGAGAPVSIIAGHQENGVSIAVHDGGPGIPAEVVPNLFQRFSRSGESLNAEPRGLGMGLVIARELIERQGGTIGLARTCDQGSVFTIWMPGVNNATYDQPV